MMTRVLVTSRPTPEVPAWPVFGIVLPRSAGWLRTASGVSPCGTDHFNAPLSRSIAERTPYGGFTIGSPCTVRPAPAPPPGGVAAAGAGAVARASCARCAVRGESAAQQSPGPSTSRNGSPAMPDTYLMSENPGGGSTTVRMPGMLRASANARCSSGSYPPPGQFVAVPTVIAPYSGPAALPTIDGLNGVSAHL